MKHIAFLYVLLHLVYINNYAKTINRISSEKKNNTVAKPLLATCSPSTAQKDLDINNVRAKLLCGGDMWFDGVDKARYEVPKGSGKYAIFSGSLWIGGIDAGKQLKVAAQTYRQDGSNDFWPGPLDINGSTDAATCSSWDKFYKITKSDIDNFIANNSTFTLDMKQWPAKNNPNNSLVGDKNLAPFFDANGDGNYNLGDGDYPEIKGDQFIWWVFNDNGNAHTETNGTAIGIEVQAQAFAYSTSDDLNNTTFYKYKVINKSSNTLYNAYIGQFTDPDLGCYQDDYVGCSPSENLGYCYNGDEKDITCASVLGYSPLYPALGVKLLETPYGENWSQVGMTAFVSYNNDQSFYGNPEKGGDYYNYLIGRWKDNTDMSYGGVGYGGGTPVKYMFPGEPCDTLSWSEWSVQTDPGDRRFLMSSGPFKIEPGLGFDFSFAVVFTTSTTGNSCTPIAKIKTMADYAKTKYDSVFPVGIKKTLPVYTASTEAIISPSLATETATITWVSSSKISYVRMYDLKGNLVKEIIKPNSEKITITRDALPSGLYLINIKDERGIDYSGKIIFSSF